MGSNQKYMRDSIIEAGIRQLCQRSYQTSADHGFHEGEPMPLDPLTTSQKLMLVVGEVNEAHEELRSGRIDKWYEETVVKGTNEYESNTKTVSQKPEGFFVELADAMIRIADLAACYPGGAEKLADAVNEKAAYNNSRPYKHGRKF